MIPVEFNTDEVANLSGYDKFIALSRWHDYLKGAKLQDKKNIGRIERMKPAYKARREAQEIRRLYAKYIKENEEAKKDEKTKQERPSKRIR